MAEAIEIAIAGYLEKSSFGSGGHRTRIDQPSSPMFAPALIPETTISGSSSNSPVIAR